MQKMRSLTLFVILGLSYGACAQIDPATIAYIDKYKGIAMEEMKRSGIPASITIAQGVLESRSGQSRLACEGNNHFGIKCHKEWTGKTIHEDDDAKNECFRKYGSADESFRDHSDFLMTRDRYDALFQIPKADYMSWAQGLKDAGYATSPTYAQSLVTIIQRYELYRYDMDDLPLAVVDTTRPSIQPPVGCPYATNVFLINRIKTVFMQPNEALVDVAEKHDKREQWLQDYNEVSATNHIEPGMHVFLQPKRKKAEEKYHRVQNDETMYQISQRYGIILDELYKKNLMVPGQEPANDETMHMRDKRSSPPKLRERIIVPLEEHAPVENKAVKQLVSMTPQPQRELESVITVKDTAVIGEDIHQEADTFEARYLFTGTIDPVDNVKSTNDPLLVTNDQELIEVVQPDANRVTQRHHTVEQGETLYSLSRKYEVTVAQLKTWNALPNDTIRIGQPIIVGIE